jgi:HSP20 family molecular chaperone IbpA
MPLRYRRVTYRYATTGTSVDQLVRRIWESERPPTWLPQTDWRPPTDVLEGPAGLLVRIEIAGMHEDDLEVTLFDDMLVVAGEREANDLDRTCWPAGQCRYHASGVRFGPFRSEVYLPIAVDADRVTARYDRGILYVTLPRAGAADAAPEERT